uniref:Uncharacterized protein n=1 Tax=Oryzias latipes TaxID=8090 RepID=A0A3B3I4D4_ORYLA
MQIFSRAVETDFQLPPQMDWIEVQRDMEAEKRRLQNILAAEKEPTAASPPKTPEAENPGAPEELLHEIEDRRQFLADMEALGQEREYISIINAEISQQLIDKKLSRNRKRQSYAYAVKNEECVT